MKPNLTRFISATTVALILLAGAARHTAGQQPTRTYPSLPGALPSTDRRPGSAREVPFDLEAYFTAPSVQQTPRRCISTRLSIRLGRMKRMTAGLSIPRTTRNPAI